MKKLVEGAATVVCLGLLSTVLGLAIMGAGGGPGPAGARTTAGTAGGTLAADKIPAEYVPWVTKAGALCPQISPALLAAQVWAESGFSAAATSRAGAQGPAQFMPATWGAWGRDEDGNGAASPRDVGDAVMAQGRLMCSLAESAARSGYPGGVVALALAGYNAGWGAVQRYAGIPPYPETTGYVQRIQAKAQEFTAPPGPTGVPAPVTGTGAGSDAVRRAAGQLGALYVYGGGTPAGPTVGFCDGSLGMLNGVCFASGHSGWDCSSLVQHAWWPTVRLPRTAADQYRATSAYRVPPAALQPGDLIFYGSPIDHVVMYYGDDKIIEAPSTGKTVRIADLRAGIVAATRPA